MLTVMEAANPHFNDDFFHDSLHSYLIEVTDSSKSKQCFDVITLHKKKSPHLSFSVLTLVPSSNEPTSYAHSFCMQLCLLLFVSNPHGLWKTIIDMLFKSCKAG